MASATTTWTFGRITVSIMFGWGTRGSKVISRQSAVGILLLEIGGNESLSSTVVVCCSGVVELVVKHEVFDALLFGPFGFLLQFHGAGKAGVGREFDDTSLGWLVLAGD
jgi:hypothetical protein